MVRFLTHINTCHLKLRRSKHLKSLSSSRRNSLRSLKLCRQMPPDSNSSCSSRNSLNSHNSLPIITRRNNNSHSKFLRKLRNNNHKLLSCKLRQLLRKLLRRHNSNSLSNSLCLRWEIQFIRVLSIFIHFGQIWYNYDPKKKITLFILGVKVTIYYSNIFW